MGQGIHGATMRVLWDRGVSRHDEAHNTHGQAAGGRLHREDSRIIARAVFDVLRRRMSYSLISLVSPTLKHLPNNSRIVPVAPTRGDAASSSRHLASGVSLPLIWF